MRRVSGGGEINVNFGNVPEEKGPEEFSSAFKTVAQNSQTYAECIENGTQAKPLNKRALKNLTETPPFGATLPLFTGAE
ncbi:MAG: hypothetical protein JXA94_04030 [Parachlamydiales bacterium]|nr:hypothetical protein [Parachlamydiales bacterium]